MKTIWYKFFCGNPKLATGTLTCCERFGQGTGEFVRFSGEEMTWLDAKTMCEGHGLEICDSPYWSEVGPGEASQARIDPHVGHWTTQDCSMKVKIDFEGQVALVHVPALEQDPKILETVREGMPTVPCLCCCVCLPE